MHAHGVCVCVSVCERACLSGNINFPLVFVLALVGCLPVREETVCFALVWFSPELQKKGKMKKENIHLKQQKKQKEREGKNSLRGLWK